MSGKNLRWEDPKMGRSEDGKIRRWEDPKMGRWEDEGMNKGVEVRSANLKFERWSSADRNIEHETLPLICNATP
jgi:hypothetical protein